MFPLLPVLLIAGRELVISVYRVLVGSKGVSVPASKIAIYKTVEQQLAVGFALRPWFAADYRWLWHSLWSAERNIYLQVVRLANDRGQKCVVMC